MVSVLKLEHIATPSDRTRQNEPREHGTRSIDLFSSPHTSQFGVPPDTITRSYVYLYSISFTQATRYQKYLS